MICHSRGFCITLIVTGIASFGPLGCTDSNPVGSIPNESDPPTSIQRETVPAEFQNSDALAAELETASDDISVVVDDIFRSIDEGTIQSLYESSTDPKFREAASLDEFSALCERVQTRLGALETKQFSRFDLTPVGESLVASASYQAQFEQGSGTIFVVLEKAEDDWLLLRLNVNAPELLDDPATFQQATELYVENSEPVLPGTMVDLLDTADEPAEVLIENVRVLNVRWKVDDPSMPLEAPAKGFVTIGLTPDETAAVGSSQALAIRRHEQ